MALVVDPKDNMTVLGCVTLEDVLEQLLEVEMFDGTFPPPLDYKTVFPNFQYRYEAINLFVIAETDLGGHLGGVTIVDESQRLKALAVAVSPVTLRASQSHLSASGLSSSSSNITLTSPDSANELLSNNDSTFTDTDAEDLRPLMH